MYSIVLAMAKAFAKIFYGHKVYGRENFCEGAAIIAGNHVSFLDPPILAISSPKEVYFLARRTLFRGLFGKFIYGLNSRPVSGEAGDVKIFREIAALLNEGKKVVLFPEGTRSPTGEFREVKPGIFLLFSRTHCAIQPAYIAGSYEIWGKGRKWPRLSGKTVCVFGSPIEWDRYAHLDKKEAQAKFAQDLKHSILSLKDWYEKGAKGTPP